MFKLIVLSAILAVSAAAPSLIGSYGLASAPLLSVPSVAQVGSVVSHVPTSISSQSSSVVHSHGAIVTPVITPVHKTIVSAPLAYSSPLLHAPLGHSPLALSAPLSLGSQWW